MSDKPEKPETRSVMLTLRVRPAGAEALDRIAADFTSRAPINPKTKKRKRIRRADVHRQALAEFTQKYDPLLKKDRR